MGIDSKIIHEARRNWRKSRNKEIAMERQTANDKLTPQQKIQKLDFRLGKGVGAVKERARLNKLITK